MVYFPHYDRSSPPLELISWLVKQGLLPPDSIEFQGADLKRYAIRRLFVSKIHEEFWALVERDFQMYEDIGRWAREEFESIVGDVDGAESVLSIASESLKKDLGFEMEDYYNFAERIEKRLLLVVLSKHPVSVVYLLAHDRYFDALRQAEEEHYREAMLEEDPDNAPEFDEVDFEEEWEANYLKHQVSEWIGQGFWAHY